MKRADPNFERVFNDTAYQDRMLNTKEAEDALKGLVDGVEMQHGTRNEKNLHVPIRSYSLATKICYDY